MRLIRLFYAAKTSILRVLPLMRDSRVPLVLKALAVAMGLLVVSPLDPFADIPVLGALDDAALLTLLCMWFVQAAGRHVQPIRVRATTGSSLAVR